MGQSEFEKLQKLSNKQKNSRKNFPLVEREISRTHVVS